MRAGSIILRLYKSTLLQVLIIVLAGAAIYSNTLHAPFQLDDDSLIKENPIIKSLDYIVHPSEAIGFKDYGLFMRRYLGFASLALNYRIHGLEYPGYHIFNISLHIINSLLLYWFVLLTFRTPLLRGTVLEKNSRVLAFIISLVFVAHPLHIEAVTYIYQRITALSFMFYVLSLCLYSMARSGDERKRTAVLYVLALLSAVAAVKTKENSLTLPLAVALYEVVFFKGSIKRRAALLAPFVLPLIVYAGTLSNTGLSVSAVVFGQKSDVSDVVTRSSYDAEYLNPSAKRMEYLFTEQRVMATYLRLLVLPVNQKFFYDYPRYRSILDTPVLLSAMLHLMLLALGGWCIVLSRQKGRAALGATGFGIWFFYITLLVESSVIPLPLVITGYRAYLPSVGFLMAVVSALALGYEKAGTERKPAIATAIIAIIVIALCFATYTRNSIWRSTISLYSDAVAKEPNIHRSNLNLGSAYYDAGDFTNAVTFLEKARQIKNVPAILFDNIHNNLSISYMQLGMYDKAIEILVEAIDRKPGVAPFHYNLARAYRAEGMWKKAVASYDRTLEIVPQHYESLMGLAEAHGAMHEQDKAIMVYRKVLGIRPGDFNANKNLSSILFEAGRIKEGLPYLSAASQARPGDAETRMLLQYYYTVVNENQN